ncbi:MAG: hypothetical protein HND51_06145 [Chloroflexi bacterium]|nr:hypothetical protein [Chloroflexota bacterium]
MYEQDEPKDKGKKKENAEKPVSLHGPTFQEVVKALAETPPIKSEDKEKKKPSN